MSRRSVAGKAAARRRLKRADKAATGLEEILADVASTQLARIVRGYRRGAEASASSAALVAAAGDLPAPPFEWRDLWNTAAWAAALEEAEMFVVEYIIDEMEVEFGIQVVAEQPFVASQAAAHVSEIEAWSDELKSTVGRLIDDGHRETLSVKQVADTLKEAGVRTQRQATLIARTEMVAASNAATHQGIRAIAEPGDMKVWIATSDQRTRDSHRKADGQKVPVGQPFIVGGKEGEYPGDSQFPVGERAACRCTFRLELG